MSAGQSPDRTMLFVAFICFIDMCGIGLMLPVMPSLIRGLTGQGLGAASAIGGWLLFVYAIMQFLCAPIIGGLSDRYGRRPVLLVTLAALGVDYALMAFAPTLAWLFVGRAISGVMGATWAAANSCVADTTDASTRGRAFGLLGAGGAAGFVIGPSIGGLLGQFGDRIPFVAASMLALGGALVGYRLLPETLSPERRRHFDWRRANPLGTIQQMAKVPVVFGFLLVIFAMQLGGQVTNAVWSFFTILQLGWSPLMIGISAAVFGIMIALVQGGLTGIAIPRFGEARTGLVGLAFAIPAYLIFAFASSTAHMYVGILIGSFGNIAFPAMQALMSRNIAENAQGELQGAVASTISITSIIGPVVMAGIFAHFSDKTGLYLPGAPFLLAAGLMALAVLIFALNIKYALTAVTEKA
jgi:DHA1 family tetracycline resistance protein-like MFS transporter